MVIVAKANTAIIMIIAVMKISKMEPLNIIYTTACLFKVILFQVYVFGLILNPHYQTITDNDCDLRY